MNAFERHPDLAREIERMASTGTTGSLADWQCFMDALNVALTKPSQPKPFYGAQCPSYPNCTGGCGLGCTHEIEAAALAKTGGVA
jgi:hypothetical protein